MIYAGRVAIGQSVFVGLQHRSDGPRAQPGFPGHSELRRLAAI